MGTRRQFERQMRVAGLLWFGIPLAVMLCVALADARQQESAAPPETAPVLTSEQQAILTNFAQKDEIIQLKLQVLQLEYAANQTEAAGYIATLQKPGYRLERVPAQDGRPLSWVYRPEPKPEEKPPPVP